MHQRHQISRRARRRRKSARTTFAVLGAALTVTILPIVGASASSQAATSSHQPNGQASSSAKVPPYPRGVFDPKEPSRFAPPPSTAMRGYKLVYVDNFKTWLSPKAWFLFKGVPGGDPVGLFEPSHVTLGRDLLRIITYKDPAYGDAWVSGGVGLWAIHPTYGAFFVRSRETGTGPDDVQLLWPKDNQWPPEIDFDEMGGNAHLTNWFIHYDTPSDQVQGHKKINILKWHTWGVIWTPKKITFTVDGFAYAVVTARNEIPHIPMMLDMQQQSFCGIGPDCPTKSTAMLINWVAVYTPT